MRITDIPPAASGVDIAQTVDINTPLYKNSIITGFSYHEVTVPTVTPERMAKPFSVPSSRKRKANCPADSRGTRAAPSSLSADSKIPLQRALRIGREQPNSKLFAREGTPF